MQFLAGDALQFEWSEEHVVLGGITQKVKVAHFRLCHSRKPFVVAYPEEPQEMVLDAYWVLLQLSANSYAKDIVSPFMPPVFAIDENMSSSKGEMCGRRSGEQSSPARFRCATALPS